MSNQFNLSEWVETNIPIKYRRLGLRIWEDCPPDVVERVREAFQLGTDIERDKVAFELRDHAATVQGLCDALEAKNETTVNVSQQSSWPVVLLLTILTTIEAWRLWYGL